MSLQSIGRIGEDFAVHYLISLGYKISERNFRTKLGELDIIAEKDTIIYFVEVKTRVGDLHGKPYEAVTPRKLSHIRRVAQAYILQKELQKRKHSLQVVSIELFPNQTVKTIKMYEVI